MTSGVRPSGPGSSAGIADRRRAERVELRGEVAVRAERLHQRHRGGDVVQHLGRDRPGRLRPAWAAGRGLHQLGSSRRESCEALLDQLVEPLVALEQVVQRSRRNAPDSAPWMTR